MPEGTALLTAAMDLGKYLCHWIVVAWSQGATGRIIDYGRIEVAGTELGLEKALLSAMRQFQGIVKQGWEGQERCSRHSNGRWLPSSVWIDAGYMTEVV